MKELRRVNEMLRKASAYFAMAELDRDGRSGKLSFRPAEENGGRENYDRIVMISASGARSVRKPLTG